MLFTWMQVGKSIEQKLDFIFSITPIVVLFLFLPIKVIKRIYTLFGE